MEKKTILFLLCILPFTTMAIPNDRYIALLLEDASNQFTAKMFSEVTKAKPGQSVVLSAISVMPPLAEIALASVGESHDELLEAIGMPNDDTTKLVFSRANTELQSAEGVTLKTANKIYVGKDYELNIAFAAVSKDTFNSEVQNIDFEDKENAAKEINTWVEDQTNNRIKDLVDPQSLSITTKAVLVNAIYFKGLWQDPFDKAVTEVKDFHINRNNVIKIPMMYREGNYGYVENEELKSQIIRIPYKGFQASLIIVLPRDIEGIIELEEKLKDPAVLDNALKQTFGTKVQVTIPKFKIETTTNMLEVLRNMNITKMFDSNEAKLYNLLKNVGDLYIGSATQKAFIEINEEGAEAAAANVFGVGGASFFPQLPTEFYADRPFYFAIQMQSLILFNGVMYGS